jgi:cyclohexa-1,5-dienecarbonyl-CoA hydratase
METDYSCLSVEDDGVVARIVLRRPPLNVLHLEMVRELNRALRDLRADGLRVLVIAAEGRVCSAGVAIQGAALGGGCELACFADLVIASEDASFGLPEVKLASFPPVAAVHFPQRIGLARTLQLVLSGDVLPARDAERIGLADKVVPAGKLAETVEAEVGKLREKSGPALRLAKRAVWQAADQDFESRLQEAEDLFLEELMKTADATEGLRAFQEKRPPAWVHR